MIETGFLVLVVLTAWMIASVSTWWVPLYLLLVVMIFVVPRQKKTVAARIECRCGR